MEVRQVMSAIANEPAWRFIESSRATGMDLARVHNKNGMMQYPVRSNYV